MTNPSVKHAHNEAFKLMTYACVCGHRETIWNSRDGVTPFGMECQSCGGMYLRHIDWKSDVYAPDHQLHKDQRFWRDGTPDEAEAIMRRRIEAYRDEHPCTPEKEAELIRIAREGEGEFRQGWPMLDRLERRNLPPSPADHLLGEIERLKANRNLFAGKYRSIIVLMDDTRQKVQAVVDHIQDEGDRAFFGSTNHADWLRDLVGDMDGWSFDAMLPKGDINKMERDPYADCRQLRTALKLAIEHIEHMAAFLGLLKAGYSFESLGEDMPGLKAALKSEGSADE